MKMWEIIVSIVLISIIIFSGKTVLMKQKEAINNYCDNKTGIYIQDGMTLNCSVKEVKEEINKDIMQALGDE